MWNIFCSSRYRGFFAVAVTLLFAYGCFSYLRPWPGIWDLWLWDETFYMGSGIYTWTGSFVNYESSPLYSYMYRLAHFFVQSPIELFYIVGLLVVVGSIVAVYFGVWYLGRSLLLAVIIGSVLVLSQFLMSGPRLIYAAITILVVGGSVGLSLKSFFARSVVLALTTYLVAYIRPEFALGFYCFCVLSLASAVWTLVDKNRRSVLFVANRRDLIVAVCALFALVVFFVTWRIPVIKGGARALMAFGQHYSLYWVNTNGVQMDAFLNWVSIMERELPGVKSELQAVLVHPGQMIRFFGFNLVSAISAAFGAAGFLFSKNFVFVAVCSGLSVLVAIKSRSAGVASVSRVPEVSTPWCHDVVLWLALALPTLISIVLIYAREHYLVILSALVSLGLALVVRRRVFDVPPLVALVVVVTFVASINPAPTVPRPNLDIVSALARQPYLGRLLELDGGWCFYVPEKCISKFAVDIPQVKDFVAYLDEDRIDAIVVSNTMKSFAEANGQKTFLSFISNPSPVGWSKVPLTPSVFLLERYGSQKVFSGNMLMQNAMGFVSNVRLGSKFGVVNDKSDMTLFVHPGLDSPTVFDFNVGEAARMSGCRRIGLIGKMDAAVPKEAVDRGAAVVDMIVAKAGVVVFSKEISVPMSAEFSVEPTENEVVEVKVDNHGNPDTDWLNLKVVFSSCDGAHK